MSCYCRGAPPSPRSDHAAAVHAERYLLIFGGGSHAACFNDLHVLDLQAVSLHFFDCQWCIMLHVFALLHLYPLWSCRWNGRDPPNRATYQLHELDMQVWLLEKIGLLSEEGIIRVVRFCQFYSSFRSSIFKHYLHSADFPSMAFFYVQYENYYIDFPDSSFSILLLYLAGASETVVLNMSTLVWSVVTSVEGRVSLASEVSCLLYEWNHNPHYTVHCTTIFSWFIKVHTIFVSRISKFPYLLQDRWSLMYRVLLLHL